MLSGVLLMSIGLSVMFFVNKPKTAREALILKNVEALADFEGILHPICMRFCTVDFDYNCIVYDAWNDERYTCLWSRPL